MVCSLLNEKLICCNGNLSVVDSFVILIKQRNGFFKCDLYIEILLRTNFKVKQSVLLKKISCLLLAYFSVVHITFIAKNNELEFVLWVYICLLQKLVSPFEHFLEGFSYCHVEDDETAVASFVENIQKGSELLLTRSVPYSELILFVFYLHCKGELVRSDSDSVLRLELLVNQSLNNRGFPYSF